MTLRTLEDIMRRAKKISHEQTRRESEDYLEMVMYRQSLQEVEQLFQDYFGQALKNAGQEAHERAVEVTNRYGGISQDQTLYYTSRENMNQMAMVWPWADGKRVTVKIIQEFE